MDDVRIKAEIIKEFIEENYLDDLYEDFFDYNDLGVPIAIAIVSDLVILTKEGEDLLNETWIELCEIFGSDPNEEYENLEDLMN